MTKGTRGREREREREFSIAILLLFILCWRRAVSIVHGVVVPRHKHTLCLARKCRSCGSGVEFSTIGRELRATPAIFGLVLGRNLLRHTDNLSVCVCKESRFCS